VVIALGGNRGSFDDDRRATDGLTGLIRQHPSDDAVGA
jgi:hypothetical protein